MKSAIALLVLTYLSTETQALTYMLKSNDWWCIHMEADINTNYELDYLITGVNPDQIEFEVRQG